MAFYKLCDCGVKNVFAHRGMAPRKCSDCGRSLLEVSVVDEDLIEEDEEIIEQPSEDLDVDRFYYSLEAVDGSGSIIIPSSGGVIGRNSLGADILEHKKAVSREHIKVTYRGRIGLLIEDISKFGTFVNDEQMVKGSNKFAREGDTIKLCNFELVVRRHEED